MIGSTVGTVIFSERQLKLLSLWFQRNWHEIETHSATVRAITRLVKALSHSIADFIRWHFFPIVLAITVGIFLAILFMPYTILGDRCYMVTIDGDNLKNTNHTRPCYHGDPVAFYVQHEDKHDIPSLFFNSALFAPQDNARWYEIYNGGHQYVVDKIYPYINFRWEVISRDDYIVLGENSCDAVNPDSPTIPIVYANIGMKLRSDPRAGLNLPDDIRNKCNYQAADSTENLYCNWYKLEFFFPHVQPIHICKPFTWIDYWLGSKKIGIKDGVPVCARRIDAFTNKPLDGKDGRWRRFGTLTDVWCD